VHNLPTPTSRNDSLPLVSSAGIATAKNLGRHIAQVALKLVRTGR
jgi:hypothetical protein